MPFGTHRQRVERQEMHSRRSKAQTILEFNSVLSWEYRACELEFEFQLASRESEKTLSTLDQHIATFSVVATPFIRFFFGIARLSRQIVPCSDSEELLKVIKLHRINGQAQKVKQDSIKKIIRHKRTKPKGISV
jgi:hypothetical protein